jgi:hypothetical protein
MLQVRRPIFISNNYAGEEFSDWFGIFKSFHGSKLCFGTFVATKLPFNAAEAG